MCDYIISLYLTKVQVFTHTHKSGVGCTSSKADAFEFYLARPIPQGLTRRFPLLAPCSIPHSSPIPAVGGSRQGSPASESIVSSWIEFGEFYYRY